VSYKIRVAPRAEAQIKKASAWWLENRSKAPTAFSEEVDRGFELARMWPSAGEPVEHSRLKGVRRILLARIRYHLYYCASPETETVEILALWHTSRGSLPPL
jgi:plasmid stabilization system protein ParE